MSEITQGWECPRCKAINAPHVDKCDCSPSQPFAIPLIPNLPEQHTVIPRPYVGDLPGWLNPPPYGIKTITVADSEALRGNRFGVWL